MSVIVDVLLNPIGIKVMVEFLLLILLLLGSAMISASEVAFFSLKPSDFKILEEKASKKSLMVLSLLKKPEQLLANILITNNFINISIVVLSTIITGGIINFSNSPLLGFLIQVIIVTFLILLIGEIIPKVFATDHRISVALFMSYQLNVISKFTYPLTFLLTKSTFFIQKRLALKGSNFSIDDLSDAIEITSDSLSDERNILEGIVKFGSTDVSEIMQSRMDIAAIEYDAPFNKLLSLIIETSYSRIPVYEDTLDNIKGIIYTKDLLPYLHEPSDFKWLGLVKQAYFVPETKKIDDLLAEFQKNKIHLAIVIDEYGGTCGLVTMEDILEEVVGEISDESDIDEELPYKKLSNNVYLFEAKILLNDFFKITGIEDTVFDEIKGEYETLAGLILELKGEIPQKNDKLEYKYFTFIIEAVDKRRIKQVKVIIKEI
jgi:gliding motility-associated protein GldE